jgi:ferritin-like metal-binding protein YciE
LLKQTLEEEKQNDNLLTQTAENNVSYATSQEEEK